MTNKNGEVNWTDIVVGSGKKNSNNGKDTFLRLASGSNLIRLLTLPHAYEQHKYMPDGGKKYGYRVNCSKTSTTACPLCDKGDRPKTRYFLGVIDRKTDTYKVLDVGPAVIQSIKTYVSDEDWGLPDQYDLDIVVDPNGGASGYYRVVCKPKKPLTASDLVKKEENDLSDLARRAAAPTTDRVVDRLKSIHEEINSNGGSNHSSNTDDSSDSGNDDDDNYFKSYDGKGKKSSF